MNKREKELKARKKIINWSQIGMFTNERVCPVCDEKNVLQIYKHDAWACIDCNEWLETICDDPNCPYCNDRPDTPYEVYWNKDFVSGSSNSRKMWRRDNYQHKMKGKFKKQCILGLN